MRDFHASVEKKKNTTHTARRGQSESGREIEHRLPRPPGGFRLLVSLVGLVSHVRVVRLLQRPGPFLSKYDSKERGVISAAYARGPFFSKCRANFLRNFNISLKKLTIAVSAPLPSKSLTFREIPKKHETSTHVCKFFCHARLFNIIGLETSKKQNN